MEKTRDGLALFEQKPGLGTNDKLGIGGLLHQKGGNAVRCYVYHGALAGYGTGMLSLTGDMGMS